MANVPVFVTADTKNNIVPVREAAAGAGVVPVAVFADPALSFNNCVPIRVALVGEIAVPIVVMVGSIDAGAILTETGDFILTEEGDHILQE